MSQSGPGPEPHLDPHVDTADLLRMRDEEGTMTAREHVDGCADCRHELESLYQVQARLRALPALAPARDRWSEVRDAVQGVRRRRRNRRAYLAVAALAATMLLVVAGRATLERWQERRVEAVLQSHVIDLRERSQLLDGELRALGAQSRLLSGWRAETIASLEDLIAEVDLRLAAASAGSAAPASKDLLELWRQRLQLQVATLDAVLVPVSSRGL